MPAQDLLTALTAMTKDQLIAEVTKREEMIYEMQARQLHLNADEQYNALVNAMRERDQHAENKNKEVAAHEATKQQWKDELDKFAKSHAGEMANLNAKHVIDKAAALKEQYRSVIVPIKMAEHARQLDELKRQQAAELGGE
jgi:hypothetical protein